MDALIRQSMQNGKHALPNGHPTLSTSPTSPTNPATTKSVKLLLRNKAALRNVSRPDGYGTLAPPQQSIPVEELERELPPKNAFQDQIPLAEVVDLIVQDAYSKLVELSDTYGLFLATHHLLFFASKRFVVLTCLLIPDSLVRLPRRAREKSSTTLQKQGRSFSRPLSLLVGRHLLTM